MQYVVVHKNKAVNRIYLSQQKHPASIPVLLLLSKENPSNFLFGALCKLSTGQPLFFERFLGDCEVRGRQTQQLSLRSVKGPVGLMK